jgi:hypothetical protein
MTKSSRTARLAIIGRDALPPPAVVPSPPSPRTPSSNPSRLPPPPAPPSCCAFAPSAPCPPSAADAPGAPEPACAAPEPAPVACPAVAAPPPGRDDLFPIEADRRERGRGYARVAGISNKQKAARTARAAATCQEHELENCRVAGLCRAEHSTKSNCDNTREANESGDRKDARWLWCVVRDLHWGAVPPMNVVRACWRGDTSNASKRHHSSTSACEAHNVARVSYAHFRASQRFPPHTADSLHHSHLPRGVCVHGVPAVRGGTVPGDPWVRRRCPPSEVQTSTKHLVQHTHS